MVSKGDPLQLSHLGWVCSIPHPEVTSLATSVLSSPVWKTGNKYMCLPYTGFICVYLTVSTISSVFCFAIESPYVVRFGFKLTTFLLQPQKCAFLDF